MVGRRKFITGVITASIVVTAGCATRGDTSVLSRQEDVIKQYFNGIHTGDLEAVNEALHPYSDAHPIDEETVSQMQYYDPEAVDTVEINGFEGMTGREVAEWSTPENATEEEIEETVENVTENEENTLDEPEVDDHQYIVMSVLIGAENEEILFEVVQDYDNSFVWVE